jgi:hypothetical protein
MSWSITLPAVCASGGSTLPISRLAASSSSPFSLTSALDTARGATPPRRRTAGTKYTGPSPRSAGRKGTPSAPPRSKMLKQTLRMNVILLLQGGAPTVAARRAARCRARHNNNKQGRLAAASEARPAGSG